MYLNFYGLKEKPFSQTPDPRFLYWNEAYRETIASLTYGIQERKGFIAMLGEAGTGKTTLLRKLLDDLGDDIVSVFLFNPNATFEEILEYTLSELGIATPSGRKLAMLQRLNEFLLAAYAEGRNTILLIDEAQDLDSDVLESLRLLSNLETADDKILQIVLSGQPELAQKLAEPGLRQLKQRIAVRCRLEPLTLEELPSYVQTRIDVVGGSNDIFDAGAFPVIWEFTSGIPRLINTVCDNALLLGYALGKRTLDRELLTEVIADLRAIDADTWDSLLPEPTPAAPASRAEVTAAPRATPPPAQDTTPPFASTRPPTAGTSRSGNSPAQIAAFVLAGVLLLIAGGWLKDLGSTASQPSGPTTAQPTNGVLPRLAPHTTDASRTISARSERNSGEPIAAGVPARTAPRLPREPQRVPVAPEPLGARAPAQAIEKAPAAGPLEPIARQVPAPEPATGRAPDTRAATRLEPIARPVPAPEPATGRAPDTRAATRLEPIARRVPAPEPATGPAEDTKPNERGEPIAQRAPSPRRGAAIDVDSELRPGGIRASIEPPSQARDLAGLVPAPTVSNPRETAPAVGAPGRLEPLRRVGSSIEGSTEVTKTQTTSSREEPESPIRAAAAPLRAEVLEGKANSVIVLEGDTLEEMAIRHYGAANTTTADMLQAANPAVASLDMIIAGDALVFPEPGPDSRIMRDGSGFVVLAMTTPALSRALALQSSLEESLSRPVSLERLAGTRGPSLFRVSVRGLGNREDASRIAQRLGPILSNPLP